MQRPDLYMVSNRNRGIIMIVKDVYLGWGLSHAHHQYYVRVSNFHFKFQVNH